MRTIWQSLAWKEWHEHKWKLASVTAVLVGCIALTWTGDENRLFSNIQVAILLAMTPLSVLIATSSATSEQSRGTLPFLSALPVSPRRVAVSKLVSGLATCLIPVLIALVGLFAWYSSSSWLGIDYQSSFALASREMTGPFDFSNWFLGVGSIVTLWVIGLFLWTVASGVNRADEVSAAAVALSVIAGIWLIWIGIWLVRQQFVAQAEDILGTKLAKIAIAFAPGGFAQSDELATLGVPLGMATLGVFVAVHSGLTTWFILRFGRFAERGIRSHQATAVNRAQLGWLAPPRRSWLTAIAWKQFRESGPLVLAGLGGLAMIVVAGLIANVGFQSKTRDIVVAIFGATFFGCLYLGGFTILIVGIGVFLRDLGPGLHTFWRSRPIAPNGWFWVKFLTGLLVAVLTFQLPMLILALIAYVNSSTMSDFERATFSFRLQMIGLITFVAIYAVAVAMTCLMRSAVFAVFLTFAVFYLGALAIFGIAFVLQKLLYQEGLVDALGEPESRPLWIAALIVAAAIGTLVGYLAIRYDWGVKSRY